MIGQTLGHFPIVEKIRTGSVIAVSNQKIRWLLAIRAAGPPHGQLNLGDTKKLCLRMMLLFLAGLVPVAAVSGEIEDEFWLAARKGDAMAVKALLVKGIDVDTKFRYGATALSYACDRGHVEVVKILLEYGADVNVKDTFYGATPLTWASSRGHTEVVKMLLDKGAEGKDGALMAGVARGNVELVKVVLDKGGLKAEALSSALANATTNNRTEIAELLRKAGAVPPPKADFQVDAETLKRYAGTYRNDSGMELAFTVKEGKLLGTFAGGNPFTLGAIDKVTFRPGEFDGVTIIFNLEGDKIIGLTVRQGGNDSLFKRVEGKQQ